MKRIIKYIVRLLLKIADVEKIAIPSINGSCCLVKERGFLELAMPNGDVIPRQIDCTISNGVRDRGLCLITITVSIPIDKDTKNKEFYNV